MRPCAKDGCPWPAAKRGYCADHQPQRPRSPSSHATGRRDFKAKRRRVLDRDGWRCQECGVELTEEPGPTKAHVDHVRPVSRQGDSSLSNLRALCKRCNERRGNR